MLLRNLALICVFSPLLGSLIAGLGGKHYVGRRGAHWATILLMIASFVCAFWSAVLVIGFHQSFYGTIYTWGQSGSFHFDIGFLIDHLTVYMMCVVTFVALLVHVYSIGYMAEDSGDQRFFSYVSLFTFMMLMLVLANNFLQLFFGWEGVGLVSYLLIGFWFNKESAIEGSLKAFIVNRVGDFGFILGIAAVLDYFGTVDFSRIFASAPNFVHTTMSIFPHTHQHIITVICILLFIGAMGKSAQIPLHVWLPESMEGPTPISALIHAATMVTAGVYMVARFSPLFQFSVPALSFVMIIGASGALFLGILAFVDNDIKRVIAYSTMSQLGYMMAANGASAYQAGIFHLSTHACFKALLFLSAGSVIVAMHENQDLRKMGNLKKYLPVTYVCFLVGALALSAIPPTSGFYSKDAIIEAVHMAVNIPGHEYAYWCLTLGAFVTGYYIFRAFFMAFHGEERYDATTRDNLKEYWVMLIPMICLAIPALIYGGFAARSVLYTEPGMLGVGSALPHAIVIKPAFNVMAELAKHYHGPWSYFGHAFVTLPFWFAVAGIFMAWFNVLLVPQFPAMLKKWLKPVYIILVEQYGFDLFNYWVFVRAGNVVYNFFYKITDMKIVDGWMVDGSGQTVTFFSRVVRRLQTGYLYHYVFVMMLGVLAFLIWWIWF